mmetsp:Transcript_22384/g.51140  ORF Transcript_22384/g.51140 Transcript_22384/m.51140 type:complete len:285 (+) Transcript_22384:82-936(+)
MATQRAIRGVAAALACAGLAAAGPSPVLVTGATGRTGVLLYKQLQAKGVAVRALVRNVTKAKDLLGCAKCDTSEGIYVGDLTKKDTLIPAMQGAGALAIVSSATPVCEGSGFDPSKCHYHKGAYPIDIDFNGGKAQIEAFAEANKGVMGPVVLCSSMGTTQPDGFLDKLGNGNINFYKLNEEAFLMSSGLPYTIVKPCGLTDGEPGKNELVASHDDELQLKPPAISRADVARVMAGALLDAKAASGLRFDLCSRAGPPTTDVSEVLKAARYPWEHTEVEAPVVI